MGFFKEGRKFLFYSIKSNYNITQVQIHENRFNSIRVMLVQGDRYGRILFFCLYIDSKEYPGYNFRKILHVQIWLD